MLYQVKTIYDKSQIEQCEKFFINQYMWDSMQEPKVYGWMGYLKDQGLFVKMVCEESNPRREFTQPRDPVCEDSAMEVFVGFAEEGKAVNNNSIYLNYEVNANGAMRVAFRKDRYDLTLLPVEDISMLNIKTIIHEQTWEVCYHVPFALIQKYIPRYQYEQGMTIRTNFYKCGDETDFPHFGIWHEYPLNEPDFHRPELFGIVVLNVSLVRKLENCTTILIHVASLSSPCLSVPSLDRIRHVL